MTKFPLRDDEFIALTGVREFDLDSLRQAVEPLGFELQMGTRFALIQTELRRLVEEQGTSYVLERLQRQWLEEVLPRSHKPGEIISLLASMLNRLAPRQDFVIVDRYLLARGFKADYPETLVSLLTPIVKIVHNLTLVTGSNYDSKLLKHLADQLSSLGSNCKIAHQTSEVFHDRFWIADRQRGLFVGTSLNGIGKRYALADYMREEDVREIVRVLASEGLLDTEPILDN
jgi:hypothetical protein